MMSLERRLLLGIAASVATLFAILLGGSTLAVRELNEAYVHARLEHDAEALLAALRPQAHGGGLGLRQRRLSPSYQQPFSGHYFVVVIGADKVERSRSLWDEELPVSPLPAGETARLRVAGPSGQELLVHVSGFERDATPVTIAVGEDITPLEEGIRRYQLLAASAVLAALALLTLVQQRVVRAALRRLDAVRADVRGVGSGEREALGEDVPREVQPLVREFNRLLAVLGQRLARSRHALGNLAHALKTPLSLLTGELEHAGEIDRRTALQQVSRIRQLVERELRRARIAGSALPGKQFAPAEDIPALVESLRRLHRERELDIRAQYPERGDLPIDREDALELLGNLLDNACKWAGARVRLRLAQGDGALTVSVEDDGAGVDEAHLQELARRGTRIDENTQGHGLGLAIVNDVVASYRGTLEFDRSPDFGGLRVRIALPRDSGPALA
jgi:signal transduction histidine kinase